MATGSPRSADGTTFEPRDGSAVDRRSYGAATIPPGLVDAYKHRVAPGDGTLRDDVAKEDDDTLLMQATENGRTLLHSGDKPSSYRWAAGCVLSRARGPPAPLGALPKASPPPVRPP